MCGYITTLMSFFNDQSKSNPRSEEMIYLTYNYRCYWKQINSTHKS